MTGTRPKAVPSPSTRPSTEGVGRRERLDAQEVHVYLTDPAALAGEDRVQRYLAQLQPDEMDRYRRLRFDVDRQGYLVTRALVRAVLSRYLARPPEAWRFVRTRHGRPLIADAEGDPEEGWLSFNLSNTRGLVACAVARSREVGVDVEWTGRPTEALAVAEQVLSPLELAHLRALPKAEQRERFFDYWTLKEAYLKARGGGLSVPLRGFSVLLEGEGPVRLALGPLLGGDAAAWQLGTWSPGPEHRLALCVRRGEDPSLAVELRTLEP